MDSSTTQITDSKVTSSAEYRGITIIERNGKMLFVLDGKQQEAESLLDATNKINEHFRSKAN